MNRKKFIKTCGQACLGGATFSLLLESCTGTYYFAETTSANHQITIPKSEFMKVTKNKTLYRKYVLVRHDTFAFPICIYKLHEGKYSALLLECTHNGCELKPNGEYLICPCHGSEFSKTGRVQHPPADQDLRNFKIKTDHENIYLLL